MKNKDAARAGVGLPLSDHRNETERSGSAKGLRSRELLKVHAVDGVTYGVARLRQLE